MTQVGLQPDSPSSATTLESKPVPDNRYDVTFSGNLAEGTPGRIIQEAGHGGRSTDDSVDATKLHR
jgi:hypothetical protein